MRSRFAELWQGAKIKIARIEQLVDYAVADDLAVFNRYRAGESIPVKELTGDWYETVAAAANRGVQVQRFRVFDLPLPEYQRYEIDWGYLVGDHYGQSTWAIRRPLYVDLLNGVGFSPVDFWVFDDRDFLLVRYSETGDWIGVEEIAPDSIEKFRQAWSLIEGHSVSLADFLRSIEHDSRRHSLVRFA